MARAVRLAAGEGGARRRGGPRANDLDKMSSAGAVVTAAAMASRSLSLVGGAFDWRGDGGGHVEEDEQLALTDGDSGLYVELLQGALAGEELLEHQHPHLGGAAPTDLVCRRPRLYPYPSSATVNDADTLLHIAVGHRRSAHRSG